MEKFKVVGTVAGVKKYERVFEAKDRKAAAKLAVADGMDRAGISVQRLGAPPPPLPSDASPPIPSGSEQIPQDSSGIPEHREVAARHAELVGAVLSLSKQLESMESRMPDRRKIRVYRLADNASLFLLWCIVLLPVGLLALGFWLSVLAGIVGRGLGGSL